MFSIPQGNLRAASDAFVQFLAGKYSLHLNAGITCQNDFSARQSDAQSRLERTEGTNSSFNKVIKTGWAYSGSGSSCRSASSPATVEDRRLPRPTVIATSRPQAAGISPAVTAGRMVVNGCRNSASPIPQAFQSFVQAKYDRAQESARCETLSSLADAQKFLQRAEDAERSYHLNVVETGWTYSPLQDRRPRRAACSGAGSSGAISSANSSGNTATRQLCSRYRSSPVEQTSWVSLCGRQRSQEPVYMTAMFSTTRKDYDPAWQTDFASFLKSKYGYQGYAGCNK